MTSTQTTSHLWTVTGAGGATTLEGTYEDVRMWARINAVGSTIERAQ